MSRTWVCCTSLILLGAILLTGCGGPSRTAPVNTDRIEFWAEERINQGFLLPIDVIYVNDYSKLRDLVALGPEKWFDSTLRDEWVEKDSLGINSGQRINLILHPVYVKRAVLIVIFANYKDLDNPAPQQVIIDSRAKREELIHVRPRALVPENPALKGLQ